MSNDIAKFPIHIVQGVPFLRGKFLLDPVPTQSAIRYRYTR
jgi:hypothetical protein